MTHTDNDSWTESKAKESIGINYVKTLLKFSGYGIMQYGIENHNHEIVKELTGNYKTPTNQMLLTMPDLVVIDKDNKEAKLVEVKYRNVNINKDNGTFLSSFGSLKNYIDYWNNAIIVIVRNTEPCCFAVNVCDINWNKHFKGFTGNGSEIWDFNNIKLDIREVFPKVTPENIDKTNKICPRHVS